jgi:hypothetical protein
MSPVMLPLIVRTTSRAFAMVWNGAATVPGFVSLPVGETKYEACASGRPPLLEAAPLELPLLELPLLELPLLELPLLEPAPLELPLLDALPLEPLLDAPLLDPPLLDPPLLLEVAPLEPLLVERLVASAPTSTSQPGATASADASARRRRATAAGGLRERVNRAIPVSGSAAARCHTPLERPPRPRAPRAAAPLHGESARSVRDRRARERVTRQGRAARFASSTREGPDARLSLAQPPRRHTGSLVRGPSGSAGTGSAAERPYSSAGDMARRRRVRRSARPTIAGTASAPPALAQPCLAEPPLVRVTDRTSSRVPASRAALDRARSLAFYGVASSNDCTFTVPPSACVA